MADSYMKAPMMRERYLVPVEGTAREAQPNGPPSASPIYKTKLQEPPKDLKPSTLYETFMNSVQKFPNNECLGSRVKKPDGTVGGFRFLSYKEVADQVAQLASGMAAIGIEPKQRVGVFGANSEHWMMSMQACNRMSNHCVPLYDSLGENAIEFIVDHAECTCVFLSSDKFPQFIKALGKIHGPLKAVVYWGDSNPECRQAVKDKGYALYSFDELKKLGAEKPADPVPPKPEELCTIMYTSGTTGDPKGVMLTHNAVVTACLNADYYCKENGIDFKPPDRLLSYLPLAHIFDRVNEEWFLMMGCAIGYWQGDIMKLLDDITELKPAMFIGVPRVFERIYSRIQGGLKEGSSLKRGIFNWAYNRKLDAMRRGNSYKKAAPLSDALVFKKVAARFGGKVKAVVSGGAPLSPHVEEFLRVIMCTAVVQGYGLTETCAVSFISVTDVFPQIGTVGTPTPLSEMRLESVPEMNYDALDPVEPKGEILIRGASNFNGYYKAQDKTDEVLESDGWFHTGDIGCLTKSGGMQIIDRKKNIFKLAQGEYVAVEKLESTYKKASPVVDQVWVYGNSFKNSLVAVVVPGPGLQSWAKEQNIEGSMEELSKNPKAEQYVLDCLTKEAKADKLKGFETVKAVHLDHRPFTIEEDLLTPTFKLKRPQLLKKYKEQVDAMYSKVN